MRKSASQIITWTLSALPEVRGTADTDGGAYSPSGQSSSYSLTTVSSSSSTDRRAETDMDGYERRGRWFEAKGVLYICLGSRPASQRFPTRTTSGYAGDPPTDLCP